VGFRPLISSANRRCAHGRANGTNSLSPTIRCLSPKFKPTRHNPQSHTARTASASLQQPLLLQRRGRILVFIAPMQMEGGLQILFLFLPRQVPAFPAHPSTIATSVHAKVGVSDQCSHGKSSSWRCLRPLSYSAARFWEASSSPKHAAHGESYVVYFS